MPASISGRLTDCLEDDDTNRAKVRRRTFWLRTNLQCLSSLDALDQLEKPQTDTHGGGRSHAATSRKNQTCRAGKSLRHVGLTQAACPHLARAIPGLEDRIAFTLGECLPQPQKTSGAA